MMFSLFFVVIALRDALSRMQQV